MLCHSEMWTLREENRCLSPRKFKYFLHLILLGLTGVELESGFKCNACGLSFHVLIVMIVIVNAY